ncbi:hypothetical protein, partial [Mesonia sp.]|uniref:hypothetical protein n=1 Tax=Mesonia sp. TaxID=1960830 RepID=UPI003F961694
MIYRKLLFFLLVLLFPVLSILAQNANKVSYIPKNSIWVEAKVGLSFYNREIARINSENINYQKINNSLRLELIPQVNYAVANRLFIGGQIGVGYDSFEVKEIGKNNTSFNYKIGAQLQYYFLKITP